MISVSKRVITRVGSLIGLAFLFLALVIALATDGPRAIGGQNLVILPSQAEEQSPIHVGEIETTNLKIGYLDRASWTQTIHYPGAAYIKVHLLQVDLLPGDYVTVSDPAAEQVYTYPGSHYTAGEREGFSALSVIGDTAIVELHSREKGASIAESEIYKKALAGAAISELGVVIDEYARGYPPDEILRRTQRPKTPCGIDERTDVICYQSSHPTEYGRSSAVAVHLLNGIESCTAWRVGPSNHMFTNEHCITDQSQLDASEFWFNYQRLACNTGDVGNVTIVTGDSLLIDDYTLDFALFTVDSFDSISSFGYLELDVREPVLNEEIYIPQHGDGDPKQFGIESDMNTGNVCRIDDAVRDGRDANTDIGYYCDTSGGSSGSPVLARSPHRVIGLHHLGISGTCPDDGMNQAVRVDRIWPLVKSYLSTSVPTPPADNAAFLADITLPDGSAVSPGQALVKTWRVRNSGTSTWSDYKLRFVGGDRLDASTETSIPTTGPQGTVDISINLTAPTQPGNYSGYFQIVNASGTEVPGGRLWVKISVQAEESRITFYFDPPSPSAANDVHITAKAEGISNVRAMRLLIDGQIVSELGSTYVDANWDTRPYADGLHSIVAQVAFHGDDGWAYPEQRGVSYELLPGREPVNKAPPPADAHPTRRLAR